MTHSSVSCCQGSGRMSLLQRQQLGRSTVGTKKRGPFLSWRKRRATCAPKSRSQPGSSQQLGVMWVRLWGQPRKQSGTSRLAPTTPKMSWGQKPGAIPRQAFLATWSRRVRDCSSSRVLFEARLNITAAVKNRKKPRQNRMQKISTCRFICWALSEPRLERQTLMASRNTSSEAQRQARAAPEKARPASPESSRAVPRQSRNRNIISSWQTITSSRLRLIRAPQKGLSLSRCLSHLQAAPVTRAGRARKAASHRLLLRQRSSCRTARNRPLQSSSLPAQYSSSRPQRREMRMSARQLVLTTASWPLRRITVSSVYYSRKSSLRQLAKGSSMYISALLPSTQRGSKRTSCSPSRLLVLLVQKLALARPALWRRKSNCIKSQAPAHSPAMSQCSNMVRATPSTRPHAQIILPKQACLLMIKERIAQLRREVVALSRLRRTNLKAISAYRAQISRAEEASVLDLLNDIAHHSSALAERQEQAQRRHSALAMREQVRAKLDTAVELNSMAKRSLGDSTRAVKQQTHTNFYRQEDQREWDTKRKWVEGRMARQARLGRAERFRMFRESKGKQSYQKRKNQELAELQRLRAQVEQAQSRLRTKQKPLPREQLFLTKQQRD